MAIHNQEGREEWKNHKFLRKHYSTQIKKVIAQKIEEFKMKVAEA